MKDESLFSFAGIWDTWKTDGKEIISCAIITTEPNELLSQVHNRMPVILHQSDFNTWLGSEIKTDDLSDLLKPFPDEYMKGFAVGTNVNSPGVDNAQLIQPLQVNG